VIKAQNMVHVMDQANGERRHQNDRGTITQSSEAAGRIHDWCPSNQMNGTKLSAARVSSWDGGHAFFLCEG
jgi:hypothetical protein